jgi:ABC-2 type transport system ATP-binding protein
MSAAILATSLKKVYPPAIEAVRDVSLEVPAGTIFGLLGPNGAGKSTTVRILCTLTSPDAGTASVAGIDVLAHPSQVRHAIGVVGQRHGAAMEATGRENLTLQGEFYGLGGSGLRRRVAEMLKRFDLTDAADRPVGTYSGGMQRRIDVALGLLHRPQVLFLDEPTTGLDPEARAEMWQEIERLATEENMTILLTTHYMEEADQLASRLAIIDRGRIVVEGSPSGLKRDLHGDSIQIELDAAAADGVAGGRAREALDRMPGISEVQVEGATVRARAEDGGAAIPGVLSALDGHRVTVASVMVSRPSLDEVYLRHAGRAFRGADERPMEVAA